MTGALLVLLLDFGVAPDGARAAGLLGQWEYGEVTVGPVGMGPGWATRPGGLTLHDTTEWLELDVVAGPDIAQPILAVEHYVHAGAGDSGWLERFDGGQWVRIAPVFGYPSSAGFVGELGWQTSYFELGDAVGQPLRLAYATDATDAGPGWAVASVALYDGDPVAPRLTPVTVPADTQEVSGPWLFEVDVADNVGIDSVVLHYQVDDGPLQAVAMAPSPSSYRAEIPGTGTTQNEIRWWVTAVDPAGNEGRYPALGEERFATYLPGVSGVELDTEQRIWGQSVTLAWQAPAGVSPDWYELRTVGEPEVIEVEGTSGQVPVARSGLWGWTVRPVYPQGAGELSDPVFAEVEVPTLEALHPNVVAPGETVWVEVVGASLYLREGATEFATSAGEVRQVEVIDSSRALVQLVVAEGQPFGRHGLAVTGVHGAASFRRVLTVDPQYQPTEVLSVEPAQVVQGASAEVVVTLSEPMGQTVELLTSEVLVVESSPEVVGEQVRVEVTARGTAAPGIYTLVLDDGERLVSFELEIRAYELPDQRSCSVSRPGALAGVGLALLPVALVRRRRRREPVTKAP